MDETLAAEKRGDVQGRKVVELKCDAVAMLTLKLLGSDPVNFVSALRKITIHLVSMDHSPNSWRHPRNSEREKFSRLFIKLLTKVKSSDDHQSGLFHGREGFDHSRHGLLGNGSAVWLDAPDSSSNFTIRGDAPAR